MTRVADAARTEVAPKDDAAAARIRRIEEAAATAAAAAERIDQGMETTGDRVASQNEGAVTRIETGLAKTCDHVAQVSRLAHRALHDIETRVSGRFSKWTIVAGVIVFILGMLLESYGLVFYRWLRAD